MLITSMLTKDDKMKSPNRYLKNKYHVVFATSLVTVGKHKTAEEAIAHSKRINKFQKREMTKVIEIK